jgi:hypothetical protein
MVQLADRISIIDKGRSADGFLKVRARAARSGVYDYLGIEVDPEGKKFKPNDVVKVYRPADEVFDKASLASFVGKPITNDHPTTPVNASNWRDLARGSIFGVVKDGDYVGFDLAFMDGATIAAIEDGKRELSNGYSCELSIEDGVTSDGTAYQAVQRNIRGNHVALVDQGRAGPECRVADSRWAACDANPAALAAFNPKEPAMAGTIMVDGLPISLADEAAVRAVLDKKDAAITAANKELADANAKVSTLTGEKTALESQLADAKAALDPAKLDAMVADRAALIGKVKAIAPTIATDGKTDADLRRAVVEAKLGDAAKAMDDAAITGAFAVLTVDAKPVETVQNIAPASPVTATDGASVVAAIRAARYA